MRDRERKIRSMGHAMMTCFLRIHVYSPQDIENGSMEPALLTNMSRLAGIAHRPTSYIAWWSSSDATQGSVATPSFL